LQMMDEEAGSVERRALLEPRLGERSSRRPG
jgi:hypothetical protein